MNVGLLRQLYTNMGSRYFFYRVSHEIEKKAGILKRKHPQNLVLKSFMNKQDWLSHLSQAGILQKNIEIERNDSLDDLKNKAERILKGNLPFFNSEWINLGLDYDWITNPSNGFKYDISKHWSEIPDLSEAAGDIKYVWEKSRFSWLLTLIRYDFHFKIDLSEFVFSEIDSWIKHNPINSGPNWRCSQEISLRIFNWFYAICYYKDSKAFTDERWEKMQNIIYASLHHVFHHINFSRIAVRNNHAVTETLFLALSNIIFPFVSKTKIWSQKGRKWFEEEVNYQVYNDGTYLQFSMNYHRVLVQLLTLGISISETVKQPFSKSVYEKAYLSLEFLYQCMQEENGWLPNYGSNDGALFFPWSDTDYRDYRPQLNTLHFILTGKELYTDLIFAEEIFWFGSAKNNAANKFSALQKFYGIKEYPHGGYILIRESDSFTFIKCGGYKDRPAQADNLHLDLWVNGKNILRDSGTYKYNTTKELSNYFTGTISHNSVVVNNESQMLKGSRFIWYFWTQKDYSKIINKENEFIFEGSISAFRHLNPSGKHVRNVTKIKGDNIWIISDKIEGLENFSKEQIWHIDDNDLKIIAKENSHVLKLKEITSHNSNYYGVVEKGKAVSIRFNNSVSTTIKLNK